MLKAYKYRLYPTPAQEQALQRAFGCARWAYNWAIEQRNKHYAETGKTLTTFDLNKLLVFEKKRNPWLYEVSDWVVRESVADCGVAFQRFFEGKASFPRFKSKRTARKTASFRRMKVDGNRVSLSKVGVVRFKAHREMHGTVKKMTVSQKPSGAYYISFMVDDGVKAPPKHPKPERGVGIDVGIKDFCTLSTGEKVANPRHFEKSRVKLAREQRRLARKSKGSKRYERQRRKVARIQEHIAAQRNDFHHKLSRRIVDENQVIAVESLSVSGILRNHKLALAVNDCGWSSFIRMLRYKCEWYGSEFLQCGRFEPSSKMCSACGETVPILPLSVREWVCPECGVLHDRDVNAAVNILKFAVAGTVNGRGGDVRRVNAERYALVFAHADSFEASSSAH